jgi:hypothetical protein
VAARLGAVERHRHYGMLIDIVGKLSAGAEGFMHDGDSLRNNPSQNLKFHQKLSQSRTCAR